MNCNEVREIIQLYLDDELDSRDTLNVQKHLESCSACSHVLDMFLEQDRLLRQEARAQNVDSHLLRERILDGIRGQAKQPLGRFSTRAAWNAPRAWKRVAAIAVLAIGAGLLLSRAGLLPGVAENVYAAVASDHADHCSIDSKLGGITERDELDRLSRAYGKLDRTPDLSAFRYGNPVGRACKVNGTLFLHLVYYNPDRQPLSIFLRPHSADLTSDGLRIFQKQERSVYSVSKSGVDVFVVTSIDDELGAAVAQTIASLL
jgi:hypothetical protein